MSIVAVTAVLIVGVVVYFLSRGASGLDLGGPFPLIAIIAFVALSPEDTTTLEHTDDAVLASSGSLIGDPNAPVTLVEFGDFQ